MTKSMILLLLLSFCLQSRMSAQSAAGPAANSRNNPFLNYRLVDSFSKAGDSVGASKHLKELDPYYVIAEWAVTPRSLDSFYSKFVLTRHARERYRKLFTASYNRPRSATYKTLEQMFKADQQIRWRLQGCGDSFTTEERTAMVAAIDTPHFTFLHKYIAKHGWPSIQDGSFFAELIAMHDHSHHKFYLPHMEKAVTDGKVAKTSYDMMLAYYKRKGDRWEEEVALSNKATIDIGEVSQFIFPGAAILAKIEAALREHCPANAIYIVCESGNARDAYKLFDDHMARVKQELPDLLTAIGHLQRASCRTDCILSVVQRTIPGVPKRLVMYLLY